MSDGAIAIIGASCRFPGAPDLDAFWELLTSGTDAVGEVDGARWSTRFFRYPGENEAGKSYTWSAGLIDGIDLFEPAFFGISPREAAQMDPQQRLLLELAWHAIEDAGLPAATLAGSATGVYVGASSTDYRDQRLGDPASADSYFMTGSTLSILANRISHVFDLRGPSLAIDTACSSSMVALHHASEAIRDGRIAGAIVAGINLLLAPYPFIGFCRASMLSRRGRCFAFDARADGYVRGEGGGAVILKPLAKALEDGDRIRAAILATGVNSDGHTIGLSLPSEAAQAELIRTVCVGAGIQPDDLAFFEMHGTGTPAGDPIEAAAVGRALGRARQAPLPIGSVKSNIGHLEPASGMAGLIKAALSLERGIIPPTLHCETPNPNIPFAEHNLRLIRNGEPIPAGRCAGVNSFGFGGTNGHAVLAAPPGRAAHAEMAELPAPPLILSARTEDSLRDLAQKWRDTIAAAPPGRVPSILRAAARRRDQHPQRLVALTESLAETIAALDDFVAGAENPAVLHGTALREGKLAFVFAGNGAQWPDMGREAHRANPDFRECVAEADRALRPALGWSVAEAIAQGIPTAELARADVAQPLLFAIQAGIAGTLRRQGIEAAAHIGHSVGEIAAAWAAGALTLADAARVVVARSRHQERTRGDGRMAAVALGAEAAAEMLAEIGSPLEVGAINASQSVTVSGPAEAIDRLVAEGRRRGVAVRPLDLEFAFHSAAMDPTRDGLLGDLADLTSARPQTMLISTVTGASVAAGQLDAGYWWRNIRNPVLFTDGIAALIEGGHRIFIEIGPNPVLQAYLHDGLRAVEGQGRVLATLTRKQGAEDPFPAIVARCHVAGFDITGAARFDGPNDHAGLPLYPWRKERFWYERTIEGGNLVDPPFDHPLLGFRQVAPVPFWLNHLDPQILPWLADHAVEGVPVMPAAAVLEMAFAIARLRRPEAAVLEVADVELRRPLPFETGRLREIRSVVSSDEGDWEVSSRPRLSEEPLTVHAVGRLVTAGDGAAKPLFGDAGNRCGEVNAGELYRLATRLGLDYGKRFRTVTRIDLFGRDRAVAHLDPSVIDEPLAPYLVHPALIDGALQGLLALLAGGAELDGSSFLPWRFGRVRLAAPFGRVPRRARLRITRIGARSASADIALYDEEGAAVAELSDCWFRRVALTRRASPEESALRLDLVPAPLAPLASPDVLGRVGAIARRLAGAARTAGRHEEHALLLDALIASAALKAVRGVVGSDISFTPDELLTGGAVASEAAALIEHLLRLLARFGAAGEAAGGWRLPGETELPDVVDVWRLLLAEAPELVAELGLIAALDAELPQLLAGGMSRPDSAPPPMIEHLLHGSPVSAAGIDVVCAALAEVAAVWPQDRPLRVLEIGADASVSRRILDRLSQSAAALDYRAATPDAEQAARLTNALSGVAGVSVVCWSPTDEAGALDGGRFDAIVSVQAFACRAIEPPALSRLAELLAPGGVFLGFEPAPSPLWEIVFGRYAGWWQGGGDAAERLPLRRSEEWQDELVRAGFAEAGSAALPKSPWPSTILWAHAPPAATDTAAPVASPTGSRVSIVGAAPAPFLERLQATGQRVRAIDAAELAAGDAPGCDNSENDREIAIFAVEAGEADDAVAAAAILMPQLTRAAAAAAQRSVPLWVITGGAQQPANDTADALLGAALWGFGRVLINEMPGLSLHLIDFSPALDWAARADAIADELAAGSEETEIVWTAAGRHVLRLRRGLPPHWAGGEENIVLAAGLQGGLDALAWQPAPPLAPGPGEVTVEVKAAGLNFRDIMWAMGLVPEEALIDGFTGPTFGLECAGIVRAVGPGITHLAPGDRVAGFAPASLGTQVKTAVHAVIPIPPETSFAAAATVPVAFVTAIYALGTLGQLAAGEVVLIHAAAGGVGLAAIQYAKHRGATVIATAGSDLKRAFLRLAGADHVLDSRSLGFADAVRAITGGAGVDVVLNSLSGEAMEQSLSALRPFGRFLELGKRDFYLNRRIHLRPLRQNISYFAIDVDQLPISRPALAQSLLEEISAALRDGAIRPLAHRVFPFAGAADAFRLMQASGHIGKLVLAPEDAAGVRLRETAECALRRDGTYLVSGGMSGFGFAAARWLAQHGAGTIALVGRRGAATPGVDDRVAELQKLGAEVRLFAGDVADPQSLAAVLDEIRSTLPPLRGLVHAASAIADGLASDLEQTAISDILRPKLGGAVNLDRLTRDDPIQLFLLFSSATTLLGAPGQAVYVAANLALEALARQRRAEGQPALAVAWGPIEDTGYLAERPDTIDALVRRLGAKPMPAAHALSALSALADGGLPVVAIAETSWSEARRYLPILAAPLFAELRGDNGAAAGDDSLLERLAGLAAEEALSLLKTVVAEEAANILRLPASALDPSRPLSEVGMDSLMAVELRLALEGRLRIDLPLMSLAEGTSVASIATRLANAVLSRARASDIVSLAERYEVVDDARLAAVADASDRFDPEEVASAAE